VLRIRGAFAESLYPIACFRIRDRTLALGQPRAPCRMRITGTNASRVPKDPQKCAKSRSFEPPSSRGLDATGPANTGGPWPLRPLTIRFIAPRRSGVRVPLAPFRPDLMCSTQTRRATASIRVQGPCRLFIDSCARRIGRVRRLRTLPFETTLGSPWSPRWRQSTVSGVLGASRLALVAAAYGIVMRRNRRVSTRTGGRSH